jgi:peptide/nickel transport system substrate-binding protein
VRQRALANVQRQLAREAPWLTIAREQIFVASTQRVTGARVHGLYGIGLHSGLDMRVR